MKGCLIAATIAGSIGILSCCALTDFFTCGGMNVCLICEASLSHHTLYMAKQKRWPKKARHRTDFEAGR